MSAEDIAQKIELQEWERNNRSRPEAKSYAAGEPGYGPELCVTEECEAVMPTQRREWGFRVCVACQADVERRRTNLRR